LTKDVDYRLRTRGKVSKREIMRSKINELYEKDKNPKAFLKALKNFDYPMYSRNGVLTGIHDPHTKRKHRFSTLLGLNKHFLLQLNREHKRLEELNEQRNSKNKEIER